MKINRMTSSIFKEYTVTKIVNIDECRIELPHNCKRVIGVKFDFESPLIPKTDMCRVGGYIYLQTKYNNVPYMYIQYIPLIIQAGIIRIYRGIKKLEYPDYIHVESFLN